MSLDIEPKVRRGRRGAFCLMSQRVYLFPESNLVKPGEGAVKARVNSPLRGRDKTRSQAILPWAG